MPEIQTKAEQANGLAKAFKELHAEMKLAGEPKNAVLNISDNLLCYLQVLLKNQASGPPSASDNEWDDFLKRLSLHGILPLMYWNIGHLGPEMCPPEPVLNRMRETYLANASASIQMEKQLCELAEAFVRQGVRVLFLKGPALAGTLYPDSATRPSADIDLLTRPEDFITCRSVLENLGYQCLERRFEKYRAFDYEEVFVLQKNKKGNCLVELHWDLLRIAGIGGSSKNEDLFQRSVKGRVSALTVEVLHPVDALIHAALHLTFKHGQDMRLIWIYDISLLARRLAVPEDWHMLQERSRDWGAVLSVEKSLQMARAWAGLKIPQGFEDFSAWPEPARIEIKAWSRATKEHSTIIDTFKLCWSGSSDMFEKARYLSHVLFPSPSIIRENYPPLHEWLLPLSYVQRWWQWLKVVFK